MFLISIRYLPLRFEPSSKSTSRKRVVVECAGFASFTARVSACSARSFDPSFRILRLSATLQTRPRKPADGERRWSRWIKNDRRVALQTSGRFVLNYGRDESSISQASRAIARTRGAGLVLFRARGKLRFDKQQRISTASEREPIAATSRRRCASSRRAGADGSRAECAADACAGEAC